MLNSEEEIVVDSEYEFEENEDINSEKPNQDDVCRFLALLLLLLSLTMIFIILSNVFVTSSRKAYIIKEVMDEDASQLGPTTFFLKPTSDISRMRDDQIIDV